MTSNPANRRLEGFGKDNETIMPDFNDHRRRIPEKWPQDLKHLVEIMPGLGLADPSLVGAWNQYLEGRCVEPASDYPELFSYWAFHFLLRRDIQGVQLLQQDEKVMDMLLCAATRTPRFTLLQHVNEPVCDD